MQKYSDILLPVETSVRELDAKLLLALFAAEAGFNCHIGTMGRIQAPGFPPSIYVSKSVRFAKSVALMSGFGHAVAAWDEEGLVRFSDDIHGSRIEAEALRIPHVLLSWGRSNSAMWRAHPFYVGRPIVETGNPRIDLLRPELRSAHLKKCAEITAKFGDFALLNTNFAMVNHFRAGGRKVRVTGRSQDSKAFLRFREGFERHKKALFDAFLAGLPSIAKKIAPYRLVIRPHPSEDPAPWVKASHSIDNISVVYEGSVAPWLLAAKCLIHNGCTSAVESSVLHTTALAYSPVADEPYDLALPNDLSEKFSDIDSLAARARELLSDTGKAKNGEYSGLLREHLASLDGPLACEKIVAAMVNLSEPGRSKAPSPVHRLRAHARYASKMGIRALFAARRKYEDHKSRPEDFALNDVARRVEVMSTALGRFQDVRLKEHSPGVLTLTTAV